MSPTARTETVLVIDDEVFVRSLTHSMLTRYGYNVITASSGEEALRLLEKWPDVEINLALVDLVMPGLLNGVQTVEAIHKLRPGLPFLYCSAYSEEEGLRPRFARGVPYIGKTFTTLK